VLARVSCNINFSKKFAIGRQDRKRNPAIVRAIVERGGDLMNISCNTCL